MAFEREFLQEIKDRISVSDVVGRKVRLQRRGQEYVGLSPFKNEKTPSFTVNDQKQFYHCFASGNHGSVFDFIMETEGLSFPEAVEQLATQAGLQMPSRDPRAAERSRERASLIEVMALAQDWFAHQLGQAAGAAAQDYLRGRGVDAALIEKFGVGYAPEGRGLVEHLTAKKIPLAQMVEAGLAIEPDKNSYRGGAAFDRFRDRIIFPIRDRRDQVIAFGGRAMSKDAKAKYLNSPETPLFHKGAVLYNFARARQSAYDSQQLLVAEGYMDVVGLARGGIDNAVAPLGTAVTEAQINQLWQLAPEPIICMDGDEAGLRAAYRLIDRALPLLKSGHSLRFAKLPHGKDPDDIISEQGAPAMQKLMSDATAMIDMVWERELLSQPADTPERAAALKKRLRTAVELIGDKDVRSLYGQEIAKRLDNLLGTPKPEAENGFRQSRGRGERWGGSNVIGFPNAAKRASRSVKNSTLARDSGGWSSGEMQIVLCVLRHPALLLEHYDVFASVNLSGALEELRFEIIDYFDNLSPPEAGSAIKEILDKQALSRHLNACGFGGSMAKLEAMPMARRLPHLQDETPINEVEEDWLEIVRLHHQLKELEGAKAEIERELETELQQDDPAAEQTLERLRAIQGKLKNLGQ